MTALRHAVKATTGGLLHRPRDVKCVYAPGVRHPGYHGPMLFLECITPIRGHRFPLRSGVNVVGRAAGTDVHIPNPSLSRHHLELEEEDGAVRMRDLGSHNGTYKNGVLITGDVPVIPGDLIQCGDVRFVLRDDAVAGRAPVAQRPESVGPSQTVALRPAATSADSPLARRLSVLLRVGELLARPGQEERLHARILDLAAEILPIDGAVLLVLGGDGGLSVSASRRTGVDAERPYSESIVRYAIEQRIAARFDDAQGDVRIDTSASIVAQSIRSAMCAPLIVDDRILGAIYVDNRISAHSFDAADLELLAGFANQAAVAMSNTALQAQLKQAAVRQSTFERFFPPATAARLLESGGELGVQELFVTALFSDISGFTALSATVPPAEVVALLHVYFPPMAHIVFEKGGTLEKYIGDAMMAVWGAPFAHDDDADRALEAAVAMHEAVVRMREVLPHPIDIHIGLHSGIVALANIGSAEYLQVATIGDATNTSARVCGVAAAGELVITRQTVDRLTRSTFPLIPLPPTLVKGKTEPLELFRVEWRR